MNAGDWTERNQRALAVELGWLRALLEAHVAGEQPALEEATGEPLDGFRSALEELSTLFGLSPFERSIVLLCAGVELDGDLARVVATAQSGVQTPTFALALASLPGAHWSALTPAAPLRSRGLIELDPGGTLVHSPLRIDERVLHLLTGVNEMDQRLTGVLQPVAPSTPRLASRQRIAMQVADAWRNAHPAERPIVQLVGPDAVAKDEIASFAASLAGRVVARLPAARIPSDGRDVAAMSRLIDREAMLGGLVLLIRTEGVTDEAARVDAVSSLAGGLTSVPIVVTTRHARDIGVPVLTIEVPRPSAAEQASVWRDHGGADVGRMVDDLVAHFDLEEHDIAAICAEIASTNGDRPAVAWTRCLHRVRPRFESLAQRIEPRATWDDLVLPQPQLHLLRQIATHVRHRARVFGDWGFSAGGDRSQGITALFVGGSGTGKTLAAEVLAGELGFDCYRVDLSQVVSKYIGETEKNLKRVFDAAEAGGAVLLFDEADALFGKRSEVKDSHDRYANIEVSYLLQQMEAYRGVAILTTNMKESLDAAFLRRIRFVVHFPFPDRDDRRRIWERVFPGRAPLGHLDLDELAGMNVAGGMIRNIAVRAAFLAVTSDEPIEMRHVHEAARAEFAKLDLPFAQMGVTASP